MPKGIPKNPQETYLKMRLSRLGKKKPKHSEWMKNNNPFKGKHHTRQTKEKIGLFNRGRPRPHTLEQNKKIGDAQRGIKGNNWRGGITPLRDAIRGCFRYRQWRSDVFSQDDFTCVLCGKRGDYLEADHFPKPFFQIIIEYKLNTIGDALACEELWSLNNGRTLCWECHNRTKLYNQHNIIKIQRSLTEI